MENKTFWKSRLAAELPPQGNTTLDGHSIHGGGKLDRLMELAHERYELGDTVHRAAPELLSVEMH